MEVIKNMIKSKCQNCEVKEDCLRYFPEYEEMVPSKNCKEIVNKRMKNDRRS